jgi:hypothetical protein
MWPWHVRRRLVAVDQLLAAWQRPGVAAIQDGDGGAGGLVSGVGVGCDAELDQGPMYAVLACGAHVVDCAGQSSRSPQQAASGVGQDLDVEPVAAVLPDCRSRGGSTAR